MYTNIGISDRYLDEPEEIEETEDFDELTNDEKYYSTKN
jgi:hypothetical protein